MPSKGLATSNTRWGLSCVVTDEAAMGVILGHMKLFGADEIGFAPIGPVRKTRAPVNGKATPEITVAGTPDKRLRAHRRGTGERKPIAEAAIAFLASVKGHEFNVADYYEHMAKAGWEAKSYAHRELNRQIDAKRVKSTDRRGVYVKLPALVKAS
jgi:hypothetical protein